MQDNYYVHMTMSQFCSELIIYTLDIPTIMEEVVKNLIQTPDEQYCITEIYNNLANLKLVFKSTRVQDTINNYFAHIREEYGMYMRQYMIEQQLTLYFFRENNDSNMSELFEYTADNISIIKSNPSLGSSVISKFLVFVTLSKTCDEFHTRMNILRDLKSLII